MSTTTTRLSLKKSQSTDLMLTIRTDLNANMEVLDDALLTNAAATFNVGYGNNGNSTNHCVGQNALDSITTGYGNTAIGYEAMLDSTEAIANVAVGYRALTNLIDGDFNVGIGRYALYTCTTGNRNIAIGASALYALTTTLGNIGIGFSAGIAATTATELVLIGYSAGSAITTGAKNTIVGYNAGSSITTGSNLTVVGYAAAASSATATNEVTLGDANVTTLRCATTTITAISDVRDKANITDLELGLEFLKDLRPRRFTWKRRATSEDGSLGEGELGADEAGFIAQELDAIQDKHSAAWMGLVGKANPDRWETTPGKLLPVVVRAIQELAAENESLRARIEALEA